MRDELDVTIFGEHDRRVLAYHADTIRVLRVLTPLGVAMAPGDTRDAYKD